MPSSPLLVSIPDDEIESEVLHRLPAKVILKAAASAAYFGAVGLKGVTVFRKGLRTASDV